MAGNTSVGNANETVVLTGQGGDAAYDGSGGSPWQFASTSPLKLSANPNTGGEWSPLAAIRPLPAGEPAPLARPSWYDYSPVDEEVGVQCYGTDYANTTAVLRALKQALGTEPPDSYPTLSVEPDGAGEAVRYELTDATVQESPTFTNKEHKNNPRLVRALCRWRRSAFGVATSVTPISAQTLTNNGGGTTGADNLLDLGDLSGLELGYEGVPMNVAFDPTAALTTPTIYAATVGERIYRAPGTSLITSTTGNGANPYSLDIQDAEVASLLNTRRGRVFLRISGASSNLEVRVRVGYSTGGTPFYTSPWLAPGTLTTLVDTGGWQLNLRRSGPILPQIAVWVDARSTNGSPTTGTLHSYELLTVWSFSRMDFPSIAASGEYAYFGTYETRQGRLDGLPVAPFAGLYFSSNRPKTFVAPRGFTPIAKHNARLWMAWVDGSTGHSTSATATIDAVASNLRRTLPLI